MTDKETVKGLGLCSSDYLGCEDGCPYLSMDIGDNSCRNNLIRDALNLILSRNKELLQKDAEIDILICKNERLKDEVSELMEENERLKKRIKAISDQIYSSTLH